MYFFVEDTIVDQEFILLSEFIYLLDQKISRICNDMEKYSDPESVGLFERGEYFIGIGFVTIQQYLSDTLIFTGISKKCAFDLGPQYSNDLTFVAVLNAAANYWKHSPEWFADDVSIKTKKTQEIIFNVIDSPDYPLSNILSKLIKSEHLAMSSLLPELLLWREAVVSLQIKYSKAPEN